jgi:hypothetical protein
MFGVAVVVLSPVVLFMEAGKRDFFRRPDRPKKRSSKRKQAKRTRADQRDDPPRSHGAFVSENP